MFGYNVLDAFLTSQIVHVAGVVHENPRFGSDGESEEASATSDEAPVKLRTKSRRFSEVSVTWNQLSPVLDFNIFLLFLLQQDINKRLSLPVDLHLPEAFVAKQNASPSLEAPLSRASRRQSLSEIGFGRLETYTKLDRLGQVRFSYDG